MRTFALVVAATALGTVAATAQGTTVIRRSEGATGSRTVIHRGADNGDAVVVRRRHVVKTRPAGCRTIIVRKANVTKKIKKCG